MELVAAKTGAPAARTPGADGPVGGVAPPPALAGVVKRRVVAVSVTGCVTGATVRLTVCVAAAMTCLAGPTAVATVCSTGVATVVAACVTASATGWATEPTAEPGACVAPLETDVALVVVWPKAPTALAATAAVEPTAAAMARGGLAEVVGTAAGIVLPPVPVVFATGLATGVATGDEEAGAAAGVAAVAPETAPVADCVVDETASVRPPA